MKPLTRSEKNRLWSECAEAKTLSARASLFGTKIEMHHGIDAAFQERDAVYDLMESKG